MSRKNNSTAHTQERTYEWTDEMELAQQEQSWKTADEIERDFAPLHPDYIPSADAFNTDANQTEPDFSATEIELPYGDNTLANKIEVGHTIYGVAFFLSRFGCDTCDLTQWGNNIIRTDEVYSIVERLELPFTEKETAKEISKLAKKGVLVKVKRGQYTAGKLQQMSIEDMTKALRATRPIKRT